MYFFILSLINKMRRYRPMSHFFKQSYITFIDYFMCKIINFTQN